jgi:hypothetical protein
VVGAGQQQAAQTAVVTTPGQPAPAPGQVAPGQVAPAQPAVDAAPTAALPTSDGDKTQVINPASQQPSAGTAPPPAASGDEPTRPDMR